ncbi:hypothetical protein [Chryseobacterium taichungense]|uniref:hypothetical protein n=1 Tax=Chryseobacterium taichungense TaxID=295069 RepID=UPI0028B063D8|nr:hypothetical protein [Chryseobacterium taichungense]
MKTYNQSFSLLENEFLQGILKQLISENYVIREILYNAVIDSKRKFLIIFMEQTADIEVLRKQYWVQKAFKEHQFKIFFHHSARAERQLSLGNPLFEFYFKSSSVVYRNENYKEPIYQLRDWKKYKKKFNTYENGFYHDHDLLSTQFNSFMSEKSSLSVVSAFEKLLEYDLECLENLYYGNYSKDNNLNKRIKALSLYVPEVQKIFVTQNSSNYYLINLCEEVRRDTTEDETIYIDEMYKALSIAEESLYRMIQLRFDELKNLIKTTATKQNESEPTLKECQKSEVVNKAVQIITFAKEIEEIYLFDTSIYGETTTYYMLLIGFNISNEFLRGIRHKIRTKSTEKYDFVLIAHDRQWIQKKLFIYQSFFANIMQSKNKIYESHSYHPELHWEEPYKGAFGNYLTIQKFYQATNNSANQIIRIIESEDKNYQGLPYLFSLFFLSFCRTYIFSKLSYEPHSLPSHFLWKLCLYANPDLKKVEYQFDEFRLRFFTYLDCNRSLRHRLDVFEAEELEKIKSITTLLMLELNKLHDRIKNNN